MPSQARGVTYVESVVNGYYLLFHYCNAISYSTSAKGEPGAKNIEAD
jgi:hypothetical protein